jgi:hypothetical protein
MKKYNILLAITALIIASLACQTIMGGGPNDLPNVPPVDSGDTTVPSDSTGPGDITVGGESPFPTTSDAFNVFSTSETVTYQSNMSSDEIIQFYKDEFGKLGYTEDSSMEANFQGIFTMGFDGHESGRKIVVAGAPLNDGSIQVTLAFQ